MYEVVLMGSARPVPAPVAAFNAHAAAEKDAYCRAINTGWAMYNDAQSALLVATARGLDRLADVLADRQADGAWPSAAFLREDAAAHRRKAESLRHTAAAWRASATHPADPPGADAPPDVSDACADLLAESRLPQLQAVPPGRAHSGRVDAP